MNLPNIKMFSTTAAKTRLEVAWWRWFAFVGCFSALGLVALEHILGFESVYTVTVIIIVMVFFTVGVIWWWWALSKVYHLVHSLGVIKEHTEEVLSEIREAKQLVKDLRDDNVGNR